MRSHMLSSTLPLLPPRSVDDFPAATVTPPVCIDSPRLIVNSDSDTMIVEVNAAASERWYRYDPYVLTQRVEIMPPSRCASETTAKVVDLSCPLRTQAHSNDNHHLCLAHCPEAADGSEYGPSMVSRSSSSSCQSPPSTILPLPSSTCSMSNLNLTAELHGGGVSLSAQHDDFNPIPKGTRRYAFVQFKFRTAYFVAPFRVAQGDVVVAALTDSSSSWCGVVRSVSTQRPAGWSETPSMHDPRLLRLARSYDRVAKADRMARETTILRGIRQTVNAASVSHSSVSYILSRVVDIELQLPAADVMCGGTPLCANESPRVLTVLVSQRTSEPTIRYHQLHHALVSVGVVAAHEPLSIVVA
mmetsp:Transcript_19138/g.21958  ORF Transcript_19138/g.21958 Transcript_19138/m.21958 type:complete len:358 (+) Transcript_19138:37-1110(+)